MEEQKKRVIAIAFKLADSVTEVDSTLKAYVNQTTQTISLSETGLINSAIEQCLAEEEPTTILLKTTVEITFARRRRRTR
jgi:hypothetical protein